MSTATLEYSSTATERLLQMLRPYEQRFHRDLSCYLHCIGEPGPLRNACEYALMGEAKRIRPALVYLTADEAGMGLDVSAAAVAIEFLHTSSLIADDLPCMDDDDERRGRWTCHRVFGEATAVLATYCLSSTAFELVAENSALLSKTPDVSPPTQPICESVVYCVARAIGGWALVGGQYSDLFERSIREEDLVRIYEQKTSSLFEAAIHLGWIFGGGHSDRLPSLRQVAKHLGVVFQLWDDLRDESQDKLRSVGANFNALLVLGVDRYKALFDRQAEAAKKALREADFQSGKLSHLLELFVCMTTDLLNQR